MKRFIISLWLVPVLAFGQTANKPVVGDANYNILPARINGHPPNLPAGSLVNGVPIGGGGTGAVSSVFGRIGDVVADPADYSAYYLPLGAAFSDIGGLLAFSQLDRTTTIIAEAATITIAANTKIKTTASGTLTTIAFSGGNDPAQARRLDVDVTGGPYTITIPTTRRLGQTGSISSITLTNGYHELSWEYIGTEYVMADSILSITFADSIVDTGGIITLLNDSASPGNSKYYGTNVSGTLGYFALPGGGGTGDVVGPSTATDNAITRFDGTTGKLIQNSSATIDDSGNITATNFSGTSSGTNTGDQTSVSGNAGTATALQTARNIDGQSFNGTANITVIAPGTHAATSKTTPVDADEMPLADSAASFILKKLTWLNLKATIKTYTDGLYPSGSGTSTGTNTGDQTSVSGNAGTATALQTARNIDGQAFDGTANITVIAPGTHAAASKTTPVDADELALVDSAASNILKKLTWANLKATLKTYFDTLYGSGTVTSFSSGNLSPLFTTSVATSTTTPALSFSLSNAAAHSYFGNNTASSAAPGFHVIDYSELSGIPSTGNLTDTGTDGITVTGGTGAVNGSGTSLSQHVADATHNGYLSSADYNTFSGGGTPAIKSSISFGLKRTSIATGKMAGYFTCPYSGTISAWNLTVDAGTITIKFWKKATGTAKPTSADSINTSGVALSTGTSIHSTTVTDFTTTTVSANDIFAVEITAVSGVTDLGGSLVITRTSL